VVPAAFALFLRERRIPARFDEPLAPHTTFRVGGPADVLVEPRDEGELVEVLRAAGEQEIPLRILGGGANLLVRDEGVRGAVVRLSRLDGRRGDRVQAGRPLPRLVRETLREGLGGLEALAGIPGTLGGAIRMNAGGRAGTIGDVVRAVEVLTLGGEFRRLPRPAVGFRYRGSALDGCVVVAAELELRPSPQAPERFASLLRDKRRTQPLDRCSAGCIFKNPPGQAAGRLIEACGLKGVRCGGARVSPRHANFIVNEGGATASDILRLIDLIRKRVPVPLELEVQVW